jgi:toxin YoeB
MRLLWEDRAWYDYLYWQTQDKKTLKRINTLIKDIQRSTFEGIGKPEPPKGFLPKNEEKVNDYRHYKEQGR